MRLENALFQVINIFKLGPDYTFVHFNASTFLAPYLYQFSAVVQIINFFGANLAMFKTGGLVQNNPMNLFV